MDLDPVVCQFADLGPVEEVARRAIDLVHHDALGLSGLERLQHGIEDRSPGLGGGLLLFEPLGDRDAVISGKAIDRVLLGI